MARAKTGKKTVAKKPHFQANLKKHSGSAVDRSGSGDHGEIPSGISSTVAQNSVIETTHIAKSSVLPEATPASQRGRAFHVKKLADIFSKLPTHIASATDKQVGQGENVFLTSTPKESDAVAHSILPNIRNSGSASMKKTAGTRVENSDETEQEETAESSEKIARDSPSYPRKQWQRTINFYFYPVEDARKWVKDELAKPSPRKRIATKKLRTPTTDEMTEVLLWGSPSRKRRTLRDLTDLEVTYTIFKHTVEEFSVCVSDRHTMKLIAKYEEYVEKSIVKKLQQVEDAKKIQEEIKKLQKENKALSSDLGSLIDRKMRPSTALEEDKVKSTPKLLKKYLKCDNSK